MTTSHPRCIQWISNYTRSTVLFILYFFCTFLAANDSRANTPFFWDDFEREDFLDSDVQWHVGSYGRTEIEMKDGSVSVTPLAATFPGIGAHTPEPVADFSLRTTIRFHEHERCCATNPWAGLLARTGGSKFYWAGPSPDGRLWIGETVNGQNIQRQTANYYNQDQQSQVRDDGQVLSDIHIQFDGVGNRFEAYAWWDGDNKPAEPQVSFVDNSPNFVPKGTGFDLIVNASNAIGVGYDVRYLALMPYLTGDYNGSGDIDPDDVRLLHTAIQDQDDNRVFDLNEDAFVNADDIQVMIHDVYGTYFGDSNLDGEFNSVDLVVVFQAGEYEDKFPRNSSWETGDWNGDGEFDSGDFVAAFQDSGYENGPRPIASVPEPPGCLLLVLGVTALVPRRTRSLSANQSF